MYFVKKHERKYPAVYNYQTWGQSLGIDLPAVKHPARTDEYNLETECSRGRIILRKRYHSVTAELRWEWEVEFVVKDRSKAYRKLRKSGVCDNLAQAARITLRKLLSTRIGSISELMRLLIKDQIMWNLAGRPNRFNV